MKIIIQTFVLLIALPILSSILFGQTKSIASGKYYAQLKESELKTGKQINKKIRIQKQYEDGKVTEILTDTVENLPPDKSRWISVGKKNGAVNKIEQITVGNTVYRKENNGAWVKREKDDYGLGIGGTDDSTTEFFFEEAFIDKEKYQVLIEKKVNYNKTYFNEGKTWINKQGLIIKRTTTTSFKDPKNIISVVEVTYDYNFMSPKIEPPIR